ncbi:MAG TPA: ABC transporter ATP-binding protein [Planctomycetota bacterium]|nr:ABC transporter ATP-binding protein [Planctomycetota bacterium]
MLSLRDLTLCYGRTPAVHHVAAEFPAGALVAVAGPNGAGKSTLLRAIVGLHPATAGSVLLDGAPAGDQRHRLAWLPQRSVVDWDFPLAVGDVVAMGRAGRLGAWRGFSAADRAAVAEALTAMGLDELIDRPIAALSGGQQQRVLIARALAGGADVLLLDEPFAGLDLNAARDLVARLRAWVGSGHRLALCALHEIDVARADFSHALLLATHLVAAGAAHEALADANLASAFAGPIVHDHGAHR